jgi:hypothetical protein
MKNPDPDEYNDAVCRFTQSCAGYTVWWIGDREILNGELTKSGGHALYSTLTIFNSR